MYFTQKSLYVILLVFSITFHGTTQVYFNKSYTLGPTSYSDFSTSILSLDSGYIVYGQNNSCNGSIGNITLRKLSETGEMEWLKEYNEPGILYGAGYPKSLIPTSDNCFALVGVTREPYPGWIRDKGLLMKLDENFDTLWLKTYGDMVEPCDTEVIFNQLIQIENGGYAILGGIMDYNVQKPIFISFKQTVWERKSLRIFMETGYFIIFHIL